MEKPGMIRASGYPTSADLSWDLLREYDLLLGKKLDDRLIADLGEVLMYGR